MVYIENKFISNPCSSMASVSIAALAAILLCLINELRVANGRWCAGAPKIRIPTKDVGMVKISAN